MRKLMTFAFFAVLAVTGQAAEPKAEPKVDWNKCGKEIKEFSCKGTDQEVWTCLEKHSSKLSDDCEEVHEGLDERFEGK